MRRALAAALLSGVALWAAAPGVGAHWLAWVALVPAAAVALRGGAGARLAVPLAYGVALELLLIRALPFGIADGQWGEPPLPVMAGGSPVLAVALLAVPLAVALLWALRFGTPWGAGAAGAIAWPALTWVVLDLVRMKYDPGGFWGPLFLSQGDAPAGDLAAVAGPLALTAVIVAVNFSLAWALVARRPAGAALAAALLTATLLVPAPGRDGSTLVVAAIQPGYDTAVDSHPANRHFRDEIYDRAALDVVADLAEPTREAARRGARLVVWPEAALWSDPRLDRRLRAALTELTNATHASIVVPLFFPGPDHGATVVIDPRGRISATQPKQRPMWFLGERDGNRRAPRPVRAIAAGAAVGTMLGVDAQDAAVARRLARRGAGVIVSATHDWEALVPAQLAYARLHARATGLPVVRADWRHGSAIFDGDGRQVAGAGSALRRTTLVARVRMGSGDTAYTRAGDTLGWAALVAVIPVGLLRARRGRYGARPWRRRLRSS